MEVVSFTSDVVFNSIFTIYAHITILVVPLFALLALTRN